MTYGIIDEGHFTFYTPRAIDEGPFSTLRHALIKVAEMIEHENYADLSIVPCKYSKRHECYVEIVGKGTVQISVDDDWPDPE